MIAGIGMNIVTTNDNNSTMANSGSVMTSVAQRRYEGQSDPLGIVVYSDLPDGACFSRTLARESARSCPATTGAGSTGSKTFRFASSSSVRRPNFAAMSHRSQTLALRQTMPNTIVSETTRRSAQYLGSFPVRAMDQSGRADFVRKQLVCMKDVPTKRSVLIVISLEGIKVCCPQGQNIYSSHALRRVSYATCDPASRLLAFLAREPQSPLHVQHCHVFRTSSPEQAEELNTLIGNAFRVAYAVQLQSGEMDPQDNVSCHGCTTMIPDRPGSAAGNNRFPRRPMFPQSKSAESLLSPDILEHCSATAGDEEEPVYETPDFSRHNPVRMSDQHHYVNDNLYTRQPEMDRCQARFSQRSLGVQRPASSQMMMSDFSSISVVPDIPDQKSAACAQKPRKQRPLVKPNTLPVLNCLFAALNKSNNNEKNVTNADDDTPYIEVPDLYHRMNNNNVATVRNGYNRKIGGSYTHDDLRLASTSQTPTPSSSQKSNSGMGMYYVSNSCSTSDSSGDSLHYGHRVMRQNASSGQHINKSKSAHVISCEVYAEVVDHTDGNHQRQGLTTITNGKLRKPTNWSIDELRGNAESQTIVSPVSRNGSSGFSSGDASTNSSGTTPPPSSNIMDEPELQSAPWFQEGMPRDLALEVLRQEPEGSFLVRASNSKTGGLALSVRVPLDFNPAGIVHYLIIRAPKGYRVKGCPKQFPSVTSLLVHHSVMPEMLPCPLSLNRYNPAFRPTEDRESNDSDHADDCEGSEEDNYLDPEQDYELISSLREGLMHNNQEEQELHHTVLQDVHQISHQADYHHSS